MKRPDLVVAGGTAVVTGAAGGMGEHIATGLARRGADLVVLDRDADGLDRVVAEIGRETPGARVTPSSSTWPTGPPPTRPSSASMTSTPA
ncbi:SDR family NAD(P)-dependent oxidoreductase [Janibacter hoylei]|uniref:SDR family NAD(P)-dependent oxidoreductase n=1 Tax=Janibacter hoylei TaxID=364298 RepID=UPI00223718DF|nr:SDR family NAD(P)-dependent oxidoreductase [Janibacter hoylei]MCW4601577.1 SDR family NAD(P)-dependent oxidoreductase [Janibacter hoylei]